MTTWIEDILRPRGFSITQAGLTGGLMVIGGIAGAAILPVLSDRYHRRVPFIILALAASTVGLIGITYAMSYPILLIAAFVMGFFLLSGSDWIPVWRRDHLPGPGGHFEWLALDDGANLWHPVYPGDGQLQGTGNRIDDNLAAGVGWVDDPWIALVHSVERINVVEAIDDRCPTRQHYPDPGRSPDLQRPDLEIQHDQKIGLIGAERRRKILPAQADRRGVYSRAGGSDRQSQRDHARLPGPAARPAAGQTALCRRPGRQPPLVSCPGRAGADRGQPGRSPGVQPSQSPRAGARPSRARLEEYTAWAATATRRG